MVAPVGFAVVVDDNAADADYYEVVFERTGLFADTRLFDEPRAALRFLQRSDRPDVNLLFLDINMPGISGFRFADEYAGLSDDRRGDAVVVMFTTSLNPDDEEAARRHPQVDDFVTKPLTPEKLRQLVETHFEGAR